MTLPSREMRFEDAKNVIVGLKTIVIHSGAAAANLANTCQFFSISRRLRFLYRMATCFIDFRVMASSEMKHLIACNPQRNAALI
jgi:hypothetical protein